MSYWDKIGRLFGPREKNISLLFDLYDNKFQKKIQQRWRIFIVRYFKIKDQVEESKKKNNLGFFDSSLNAYLLNTMFNYCSIIS